MSASHKPQPDQLDSSGPEEWVRVPAVVDANGDRVVTIYDAQGRPQTRLVAELVLEAFQGARPPGHVVGFKDGDRLNCALTNLEWVIPGLPRPDELARAKAVATRQRADEIRARLEGRPHSDSALLVAEDRLR